MVKSTKLVKIEKVQKPKFRIVHNPEFSSISIVNAGDQPLITLAINHRWILPNNEAYQKNSSGYKNIMGVWGESVDNLSHYTGLKDSILLTLDFTYCGTQTHDSSILRPKFYVERYSHVLRKELNDGSPVGHAAALLTAFMNSDQFVWFVRAREGWQKPEPKVEPVKTSDSRILVDLTLGGTRKGVQYITDLDGTPLEIRETKKLVGDFEFVLGTSGDLAIEIKDNEKKIIVGNIVFKRGANAISDKVRIAGALIDLSVLQIESQTVELNFPHEIEILDAADAVFQYIATRPYYEKLEHLAKLAPSVETVNEALSTSRLTLDCLTDGESNISCVELMKTDSERKRLTIISWDRAVYM